MLGLQVRADARGGLGVDEVGGDERGGRPERARERAEAVLAAGDEHQGRAGLPGQALRRGLADAARRAGDQVDGAAHGRDSSAAGQRTGCRPIGRRLPSRAHMSTTVQQCALSARERMRASATRETAILAALVVAGAALRAASVSAQSFWDDELFTVWIVNLPVGDALTAIAHTQALPYLYFALAWPWAHIFGDGEAQLRALSVVLGTAAIPITWACCRGRVGLAAAGVVALNPFLVWYGQEARPYALLVPLAALSVLFMLRGRLWWWALVAALLLATHYFAVFLLAAEGLWLLRLHGRRMLAPLGAVGVAGMALLPLLATQLAHLTDPGGLEGQSLPSRLGATPKNFLVAYNGPLELVFTVVAGLLGLAAIALALTRATPANRRLAVAGVVVALASLAIPVAGALVGFDYVSSRNLLAAMLPGALAVGAGVASGRAGLLVGAALAAIWVTVGLAFTVDARYQRLDWRSASRAVGAPGAERALIFSPGCGYLGPCRQKFPGVRRVPPAGARVSEIVVLSLATEGITGTGARHPPPASPAPAAPAGFTLVEQRAAPTYTLLRFRAPSARPVPAAALGSMHLGTAPSAALRYSSRRALSTAPTS